MTDQSGGTASIEPEQEKPKARRGPRKESEIRAEVEAEMRAEMQAERDRIAAEVRAEVEQEQEDARKQREFERSAHDASPISGFDISGKPDAEGAVTIHFVDDGFTVLGKVWYRGEELTITPGSEQWEHAPDYNGKKFCLMDEFDQEEVWGQRFFREGPWRGKRLTDIEDPEMTDADREALAKAERTRNERYGVLPQR